MDPTEAVEFLASIAGGGQVLESEGHFVVEAFVPGCRALLVRPVDDDARDR
jgi:hypothetical protein